MKSQPHVTPGQTPQRSTDALETSAAAACAAIQTMRSSGGSASSSPVQTQSMAGARFAPVRRTVIGGAAGAARGRARRRARRNRRRRRDARAVSRLRATVSRRPQPAGSAAVLRRACRPRGVDACDRCVSDRSRRRLQRRAGMSAGRAPGRVEADRPRVSRCPCRFRYAGGIAHRIGREHVPRTGNRGR